MICHVCHADDGSHAWRSTLKRSDSGEYAFWCTRFGCQHQWHYKTSSECDCRDYINSQSVRGSP